MLEVMPKTVSTKKAPDQGKKLEQVYVETSVVVGIGDGSSTVTAGEAEGAAGDAESGAEAPVATVFEDQQSELVQYLLEQDPLLTGKDLQHFQPCGYREARIDKVAPRLYLGSRHEAKDLAGLQSLGVLAIVNVAASDVENAYEGTFTYHNIAVSDKKDEQGHRANMLPFLEPAADFIANSLQSGACFVHCMGGYSRSPTVAIAYLIKHGSLNLTDAQQLIKRVRPQIEPNEGFMEQLREFERMHGGATSKSQGVLPKAGRKKK